MYCCFDVLVRVLRHLGYSVTYVRNFTDIDDKIIARAREAGEDPLALARRHDPCLMTVPPSLLCTRGDTARQTSITSHNTSLNAALCVDQTGHWR